MGVFAILIIAINAYWTSVKGFFGSFKVNNAGVG
jgi:hypothetical protein